MNTCYTCHEKHDEVTLTIRNQILMAKKHFSLQHSESVVVQTASQIYAAYIVSGRVTEGEEDLWMRRSIREAMMIAQATDDAIISDGEIDADEREGLSDISSGHNVRTGRSRHDP